MDKKFTINGLRASMSTRVSCGETNIRGHIYPFISDFHKIDFALDIKRSSKCGSSAESSVRLNGTWSGATLSQYMRAVEAAQQKVNELETFANNLMDHSDAAYAVTSALEEEDYERAHMLVSLLSDIYKEMNTRCNWNYRSTNGRHDKTLFDAIVYHDSFSKALSIIEKSIMLIADRKYHEMTETEEMVFRIGDMLTEKSRIKGFSSSHAEMLTILQLVTEGESILDIKEGGDERDRFDKRLAENKGFINEVKEKADARVKAEEEAKAEAEAAKSQQKEENSAE